MKHLVYFSVFLNKDMLELLKLLLMSMKLYSNTDTFDILIITSEEFVKDIDVISKIFDLELMVYVTSGSTVEEAVMSRVYIFNYLNMDIYSKVLYLDIDILIQGDITDIFNLEIEDKLYAINEEGLKIDSIYHGNDFFDFSKTDKSILAINAGVLLFKSSKTMKSLFLSITNHYEQIKKENKSYVAVDQQLLNYYVVTQGLAGNVNVISKYVKLVSRLPGADYPISPLENKGVIIQHFYAGIMPKKQRMKYHLEHLIDSYSSVNRIRIDTSNQIQFKQYTWNSGNILFESPDKSKLVTTWQSGSYECLHKNVYKLVWSKLKHLVIFSKDFSRYTSVRVDTMSIDHGTEMNEFRTTIPEIIPMEEPALTSTKYLVYFCVFHNTEYLSLVELLLLSARVFSSDSLNKVDLLIFTNSETTQKLHNLINKLDTPLHVHFLTINSQHQAGCARLHIFDYPYINKYSKILYLDTDILVQGDLMRVFDCLKEDKVYAVKEYDIYGPGHGAYFFDFSKIDKNTPSLNSGILLFQNSAKTRSLFATINEHIRRMRESDSLFPGCMDQPFIAYNLIQHNHCELESLSKLAFLAEHVSPPLNDTIVLSHFVWPIGNVWHKYNRMKEHFKALLKERVEVSSINSDSLEYSIGKYVPSFNILIATTGRVKLQQMLDSLSSQLEERDCVTIVYDGLNKIPKFDLTMFKCEVQQFCEPVALGYWGHGIRNKYASLLEKRDFIMHADDDDIYFEGSFNKLRKECIFPNTLYIAKTKNSEPGAIRSSCDIMPRSNKIIIGQIGTPCGIIPYSLNKEGIWEICYGGDGMFYKHIEKKANYIQFLSFFIYNINPIVNTIYCFWTGTNEMSENRKRCLKSLKEISQCNVVLVTHDTLTTYILPKHPLHPAYEYLSETHKSDYLRTYFMNFYGGGYSDIKEPTESWTKAFDEFRNSNSWICGFKETGENDIGYKPYAKFWRDLVGTSCLIAKANTELTNVWYSSMISLLDEKLPVLKANPSKNPQDRSEYGNGYPIAWTEMLGNIYHKVCYEYKDRLLNTLPRPSIQNYR